MSIGSGLEVTCKRVCFALHFEIITTATPTIPYYYNKPQIPWLLLDVNVANVRALYLDFHSYIVQFSLFRR